MLGFASASFGDTAEVEGSSIRATDRQHATCNDTQSYIEKPNPAHDKYIGALERAAEEQAPGQKASAQKKVHGVANIEI
jgi:hypothetical protein